MLNLQFLIQFGQQTLDVANEAIDVALPARLVNDVLVVIVAQPPAQFLIRHAGLVLTLAPAPGHLAGNEREEGGGGMSKQSIGTDNQKPILARVLTQALLTCGFVSR